MGRQAAEPSDRAIPGGMDGTASLPAQQVHPTASLASEPKALLAFAEELGRLVARRLLTDTDRRVGYSLIELLWGAAVMALLVSLAARSFGW